MYRSCGFQSVPLAFNNVTMRAKRYSDFHGILDEAELEGVSQDLVGAVPLFYRVTPADLQDETTVKLLMRMHEEFHRGRFDGPIVRDHVEYWQRWMPCNMRDSGFLLLRSRSKEEDGQDVRGFLSLGYDKWKDLFFLADFFVGSEELTSDGGCHALLVGGRGGGA